MVCLRAIRHASLPGIAIFVSALAAATPSRAQQFTPQAPDTMAARMEACTPCHGTDGQGTSNDYFPRIAGKPTGYLYNQLAEFHIGQRRYAPMNYLFEFLPDSYLRDIATYFASLHPPAPTPLPPTVSPEILAEGENIVLHGDGSREIPACASCHGRALTGMEPAIPALIGLRANYISAQLGAWRYGTRTAKAPDCMQLVAARLTENNVTAVAAYLAAQPVPPDARPLPSGTLALPFACGSEPQ